MAMHKSILTLLSPFLHHGTRHVIFHQCRTFRPTTRCFSSIHPGQIRPSQTHHHRYLKCEPAFRSLSPVSSGRQYCRFNGLKKLQCHGVVSSQLCLRHLSSNQQSGTTRLLRDYQLSTIKPSCQTSSALFGKMCMKHKHTNSSDRTSTDDTPSGSENASEEAIEYKEIPVLIQHKTTKKPQHRQVIKMFRGLRGIEQVKEKITITPGLDVGMEKITDDPKAVDLKKRIKKPAKRVAKTDMLMCSSYTTAEYYYLDRLKKTLLKYGKYLPVDLPQDADGVLYMHLVEPSKDSIQDESTEMLFFEEGAVVFWNASPHLIKDILWILEYHQRGPYEEETVYEENEQINYRHQEKETSVNSKGVITFDTRDPNKLPLEKFAISNAIMHSVKLAMWENSLDQFVESIEYIPDYMSLGKPITLSKEEVMRKRGKLFALRHRINLSSDLLIASDFYWDRDNLETLYQKMCHFFSIDRRTKVMNEKLNHCSELVELMRTTLTEKHSTRLEWMIIILIAVEVVFEFIHYIKLYFIGDKQSAQEHKSTQKSATVT